MHIYAYVPVHIKRTSSSLLISSASMFRVASASSPAVPGGGRQCIYVLIRYIYIKRYSYRYVCIDLYVHIYIFTYMYVYTYITYLL